jgi:hypothetical protein
MSVPSLPSALTFFTVRLQGEDRGLWLLRRLRWPRGLVRLGVSPEPLPPPLPTTPRSQRLRGQWSQAELLGGRPSPLTDLTSLVSQASSLIDDEILRVDFERMKQAKEARVSMTSHPSDLPMPPPPKSSSATTPPLPPALRSEKVPLSPLLLLPHHLSQSSKQQANTASPKDPARRPGSLMKEAGPQAFAGAEGNPPLLTCSPFSGSTAVVAIIYGGWPYDPASQSLETSPRNSVTSSSSRRSSGATAKSLVSFNSSHSLTHHDSFIKPAISDLEVVHEDSPGSPPSESPPSLHTLIEK